MKKIPIYFAIIIILLSSFFIFTIFIQENIDQKISFFEEENSKRLLLNEIKTSRSNTQFYPNVERPNFVEIAEESINTVVHVKSVSSEKKLTIEDFVFGENFKKPEVGSGSGVIISSDGT